MKGLKRVACITATATLTACGGGGGPNTINTSVTSTGILLDAAVDGISYKTATQSGVTADGGKFSYIEGETVNFSLGSIMLPSVTADAKITPFDIAGSTDINNDKVVNLLVFLQSIDEDGNPTNGISINEATRTSAKNSIDFSVSKAAFRVLPALTNVIVAARGPGAEPVSEALAAMHFQRTIAAEGLTASNTNSTAVTQQQNATVVTSAALTIF